MARHVLLVGSPTGTQLRQHLRQRGFLVLGTHEANQTLRRAGEQQPDLIVLAGPEPDPSSLCRALKFQRNTNLVPIVQIASAPSSSHLFVQPEARLPDPTSPVAVSAALDHALAVASTRRDEGILAELIVHVPSDLDELEALCLLLPDWLAGCGLTPFQVQQFNLAIREVVANAIEWGHGYERSRLVGVECRLDEEKVTVLVGDTGPGFDRSNLPHAARPGDPFSHLGVRAERKLRDGGFGILMASGLVDHLCYSVTGNEGLLVKYLPGQARSHAVTESGQRTRRVAP